MQLRSANSNSRGSGEEQHSSTNINGVQRIKSGDIDFLDGLPLYHRRSAAVRRNSSWSRSLEIWFHVILVILLLCIFFLWWFSFPELIKFAIDRQ
ncbi:hypothetical protein Lal_00034497 [Lupinus albus]|nr:hypothetical protein Lal_00034497 [Lupinus albus]